MQDLYLFQIRQPPGYGLGGVCPLAFPPPVVAGTSWGSVSLCQAPQVGSKSVGHAFRVLGALGASLWLQLEHATTSALFHAPLPLVAASALLPVSVDF